MRWVHVGDVDLTGLLQGGELVLTTGAAFARSPEAYLKSLARSDALGVIVELSADFPEVPPRAIECARVEGLALVALHTAVRFVVITEAVHRRIVAEQYEAVAFDRLVHQTFTELSVQRVSAAGIVDAASDMLNEPVVLEDLAHHMLAVSTTARARAGVVLFDWENRSRVSPGARPTSEAWVTTPVGPRGEVWGRLIVPRSSSHPERARTVLERAAVALAFDRMVERDRVGLQFRAQNGLIGDVLDRRITDDEDVTARALALGLRRAHVFHPLVIRILERDASPDPVVVQRQGATYLDAVFASIRATGHSCISAIRQQGEVSLLVAFRTDRGSEHNRLAEAATAVKQALVRLDGVVGCVVGVGDADARVIDAIRNLEAARHVAGVAEAMSEPRRAFYTATDIRLRGLVALLRDDPRVQAFAENELRRLFVDTAPRNPQHLDILSAYLSGGGNKAEVAKRLHMSRPALYKRLDDIEEILGVDLSDPESALSLHVAVLVHESQRPI